MSAAYLVCDRLFHSKSFFSGERAMSAFVKTSFVGMALVALLVSGAQAAGVVGYWQFNEQAPGEQTIGAPGEIIDSANGHNGTASGTTLPSYVASSAKNPPSALGFSPSASQKVVVPDSTGAFNMMFGSLKSYTIEAIVKMPQNAGANMASIMCKRAGSAGSYFDFQVQQAGVTDEAGGNPGCLGFDIWTNTSTNEFTWPWLTDNVRVDDGNWHHVALVLSTNANPALSSYQFYVDYQPTSGGVLDGKMYLGGGWTNQNMANAGDVQIGAAGWNSGSYLNGNLDMVRFSDVALVPSQFVGVPEPSSVVLLGTLLMGLLAYAWRKRK
jgi:hypothetical protein